MKTIALFIVYGLIAFALAQDAVTLRTSCRPEDDNPRFSRSLVLPDKSRFFVPHAANFTLQRSNRVNQNVVVSIERLCGGFNDLNCVYNGTVLTFQGCFVNGVLDAFFTPGQEVYFPSKITLSTSCQPDRDRPVTFKPTVFIRKPCENFDTPQEAAVKLYEDLIFTLNFGPVYTMFATDIIFNVQGFAHPFLGRDAAFAYVTINDPNISDLFAIIAQRTPTTTQAGNKVAARVFQTWKSLQLPDGNPLQIWDNDQFIEFVFNEYNQFKELSAFLDTAGFIIRFPLIEEPNITLTCEKIQNSCNTPTTQQYPSVQDCVTFMNTIANNVPLQPPTAGNSVQCRAFHEVLARSLPSVHCIHTGPLKISPFATPCQDFTA